MEEVENKIKAVEDKLIKLSNKKDDFLATHREAAMALHAELMDLQKERRKAILQQQIDDIDNGVEPQTETVIQFGEPEVGA